jgi:hypothetical protein
MNVVFNGECLKFFLSAPIQDIKNRIVGGPVQTLTVTNSRIKGNKQGVRASFYNRLVYISTVKYSQAIQCTGDSSICGVCTVLRNSGNLSETYRVLYQNKVEK